MLEESFVDTLECKKDKQVSLRSNQTWTVSGGKSDEVEAVLLWAHHEKARFSGKDNNSGNGGKLQEQSETEYRTG